MAMGYVFSPHAPRTYMAILDGFVLGPRLYSFVGDDARSARTAICSSSAERRTDEFIEHSESTCSLRSQRLEPEARPSQMATDVPGDVRKSLNRYAMRPYIYVGIQIQRREPLTSGRKVYSEFSRTVLGTTRGPWDHFPLPPLRVHEVFARRRSHFGPPACRMNDFRRPAPTLPDPAPRVRSYQPTIRFDDGGVVL